MEDLVVRRVTHPDARLLQQLQSFESEAFGGLGLRSYDLAVVAEVGMVLVASVGEETVGGSQLVRILDDPGFFFVIGFYVRPDWQGRRLGKALLSAVAHEARGAGAEGLVLTVSPDNRGAMRLYKSAGFIDEAFMADFYGDGEHRHLLRWRFA